MDKVTTDGIIGKEKSILSGSLNTTTTIMITESELGFEKRPELFSSEFSDGHHQDQEDDYDDDDDDDDDDDVMVDGDEKETKEIASGEQSTSTTSDESIKMLTLLNNFSEEQFRRYEMYRRSKFSKSVIKKLVKHITGGDVVINEKTAIALAGIAKVYVGQLIEIALDYMEELGGTPGKHPIEPRHLREAVRRLRNKDKRTTTFKPIF